MREFLWGAVAGAFGEGMMHPVDTVKTRIQGQAILSASQKPKSIMHMVRAVWAADGLRGFYTGIAPGVTGSLATGATYFGVIESTKKWIEESHPSLEGHWAHFIAGALGTQKACIPSLCISGDTLGSVVYVPCEVMKQRMQVQGTMASWSSVVMKDNIAMKPGIQIYWSTLARDVPFAGLMVGFVLQRLERFDRVGKQKYIQDPNFHTNSSVKGLALGGLAGGMYKGWLDAIRSVWRAEGAPGMFRGSIPRIAWYIPASALTFMAVEFLREHFNEGLSNENSREVASMSVEKKSKTSGKRPHCASYLLECAPLHFSVLSPSPSQWPPRTTTRRLLAEPPPGPPPRLGLVVPTRRLFLLSSHLSHHHLSLPPPPHSVSPGHHPRGSTSSLRSSLTGLLLGCCIRRKCGDTVHMDAEDSSGKRPTSSKRKRKTSTDGAQLDSQTTVWGDKILKGPFPGGPEDPRVLRSFPSHVAAAIWHNVRIARLLAIMEPISQSNLRCACKFYEAFEQVRSILQGSEAEIAATAAAAQAEPATPVPSASTTQNIADPAAPVSSASATQDVAEPAAAQDVAEPATPVPSTSATQDVAEPAAAQDVAGRVALPLVFGSSSSFVKNSESKDNPLSLPPPPETPIFWPPDGTLSLEWVRNLMSTFDWASRNLEPNQFPDVFPMEVFDSLVLCAFNILHKEANCIAVDQLGMESTVVVVGDIHGQLHDLLFLLNDAGFPSENRLYVFNGDYVDRGAWGIETFLILLAWKVFLPKSVYLLRGNHESKYCTSVYGFEKEVLTKYGGDKGKDVYQKCLECFKRLPLTSIIGKYVYTAHGGLFRSMVAYPKRSKGKKRRKISFVPELSSKLSLGTFEELKKAQRSVLNPPWMGSNLIPGDVLWSDPSMDPGLSLNEERGIGLLWGPDCTEEFLKKFQLKLIIRSHEGPDARDKRPGLGGMDNGFTIDHTVESGKLITLFSAPDYPQFQATEDRYRNKGAYIVLEPPNFDDPVIHSFEAITPRPQANPFYDFEEVADSDQELDFASPSMETSP
ncbi:hypothetical protein DVH24_008944 [Malus domestica]|uniref:Serine/threonine-protein phosphatase n=1 Tax=Malus domestica TaxID=3750 RepID=A0A498JLK1_MALDO|nr:hypothetical protein DVH24_008944 [Malus domestica]